MTEQRELLSFRDSSFTLTGPRRVHRVHVNPEHSTMSFVRLIKIVVSIIVSFDATGAEIGNTCICRYGAFASHVKGCNGRHVKSVPLFQLLFVLLQAWLHCCH
jgi:hypothetical protein